MSFEFAIDRTFDAPRDLVFRVWTEAEHLQQWFGPKGVTMFHCSNDFRPGGVMLYGLRSPGMGDYWGRWVYREIVPPEKLVFIVSFSDAEGGVTRHPMAPDWPLHTLSTITFEPEGENKTKVTVRWTPWDATEPEEKAFEAGATSMQGGWTGTFENLEAYLQAVRK